MPALFAASNPIIYFYLLVFLWLLFIKGLILWWIIQAMIKYRWVRWVVLGLIAFNALAFGCLILAFAFRPRPPTWTSAPQAPAAPVSATPAPRESSPSQGDSSEDRAVILIRVSNDADVWLEGRKGKQTGRSRRFQTPPLEPGEDYDYEVRARWLEGDRVMDQTRRVKVRAGGKTEVDFTRPESVRPS